jgi:hypothetical protein
MNFIQKFFTKTEPLPAGTHHMQATQDEKPYRLHLRLQKDGSGLLILNAATVLQLNPTAAEYAYHFIKGTSPDEAAKQIAARYQVNRKTALTDFNNFADQIQTLISTPDLDPASFLNFERVQPHSTESTLRLDCALTYRLPESTHAKYAPTKRVDRELTTEEWQTILDKAWQAGIPHIIFTGGEPTLREDLPQLIAHAEKNGQVCGLLTDGLKLAEKESLELLLQTGLDHVMLILQPMSQNHGKPSRSSFLKIFSSLYTSPSIKKMSRKPKTSCRKLPISTCKTFLLAQPMAACLTKCLSCRIPPVPSASPCAGICRAASNCSIETVDDAIPTGAGKPDVRRT